MDASPLNEKKPVEKLRKATIVIPVKAQIVGPAKAN